MANKNKLSKPYNNCAKLLKEMIVHLDMTINAYYALTGALPEQLRQFEGMDECLSHLWDALIAASGWTSFTERFIGQAYFNYLMKGGDKNEEVPTCHNDSDGSRPMDYPPMGTVNGGDNLRPDLG